MLKGVIWIALFILLSSPIFGLIGDFDESRCVDFDDFLLFAEYYQNELNKDNDMFDLDKNGEIDVEDFFIFADRYGKCDEKNLLIDLRHQYGAWRFLKKGNTDLILGVPVILNRIDIPSKRFDLSVDNKPYNNLKIGDRVDHESFTIFIEDFSENELYYKFKIKNPLIKILDSLNIGYDIHSNEESVETPKSTITFIDDKPFPELAELYKYKNVFWVVSRNDFKDELQLKKFERYLNRGGNLFIFFGDVLPLPRENREMLSFLPEVTFSNDALEISSISLGRKSNLLNGLSSLELAKNNNMEVVAFDTGPFDLRREQWDRLSKDELYHGVVLTIDYFGTLLYADTFRGSKVIISSLNFDRRIPSDFSKQFFGNIFEWAKAPVEICSNNIDDDGNNRVDCDDINCFASNQCKSCVEDGLFENDCSLVFTSLICQDKTTVYDCQKCGCLEGLSCRDDGGCERVSPGPIFGNFTSQDAYFINEFHSDVFFGFNVIEPDGLQNEKGIAVIRDEQGYLRKLSDDIYCSKPRNTLTNSYECSFIVENEKNIISKPGDYSLKISLTNNNKITTISDWFDFKVLDLPKCNNINDKVGISPEKNAVKVVFYADNYDDYGSFKNRVMEVTKKMFEVHEIYNNYRNKFDFYVSEYLAKDNCKAPDEFKRLQCNEFFNSLFYSRSCGEDVGVVFSNRIFRSDSTVHLSVHPEDIKVFGHGDVEKVLAHELGHNPIGLGDAYCEHKRYTTPTPYPNTFDTLEECNLYSKTRLGGRRCIPICDGDGDFNDKNGGYIMDHSGPIMMIHGGDFNLVEQMRVNWFFDCCTPNSCSDLPKYCSSNICGSCSSKDDDIFLPPCAEVVCKESEIEEDIDEDGSSKRLDCGLNDYAIHPGTPIVPFIDVGDRLSESCTNVDYNCDGKIEKQCHYTPGCPDLSRSKCINIHEYVIEKAQTQEACCGGCSGKVSEWVAFKDSCGENEICTDVVDIDGETFAKCKSKGIEVPSTPVEVTSTIQVGGKKR